MERSNLLSRPSEKVWSTNAQTNGDVWTNPFWRKIALFACLGVTVLGFLYYVRAYIRAGKYWVANTDYQVFYAAAVAVRHHSNPFVSSIAWIQQYSPTHHLGMAFATKSYVYPPFFALLQTPFSLLPLRPALVLWDLCNIVFLVGALYAMLRVTGIRPSRLGIFVLVVSSVLTDPVRKELFVAQADIFLLFLICASLWARYEQRPRLAGILLAVACAIKPPLLVWVAFLLWKREWKFAVTAIVGVAIFFFAPFLWLGRQVWSDQLTIFHFWSTQFLAYDHNDSPKGLLVRLFTVNPVVRPLFSAPVIVTVVWVAVAALVLLLTLSRISPRPLQRDMRSLLEIGLVVPAALLITPLTEWPYLLMLTIPLLTLYRWARDSDAQARPVRTVVFSALTVFVLLTGPLTWTENRFASHMGTRSVLADLYVLAAPGYLYLLIALFALQLYVLRLVTGQPTVPAIRRLIQDLPVIIREWVRELAAALRSVLAAPRQNQERR